MERDLRGGFGKSRLSDGVEKLSALAEEKLWCGDGVPEHVAEAAESGGVFCDSVPVGERSFGGVSADAFEARGVLEDCAGVEGVEREGLAGSEGRGQSENGFAGFAGVVGVGVEQVLREREVEAGGVGLVAIDHGGAFPRKGGRDLEREMCERCGAVVAYGDVGAHAEVRGRGRDAGVERVSGDVERGALGVGDVGGGCGGGVFVFQLRSVGLSLRCVGRDFFVPFKNDLAFRIRTLRCVGSLRDTVKRRKEDASDKKASTSKPRNQ